MKNNVDPTVCVFIMLALLAVMFFAVSASCKKQIKEISLSPEEEPTDEQCANVCTIFPCQPTMGLPGCTHELTVVVDFVCWSECRNTAWTTYLCRCLPDGSHQSQKLGNY